MEDTFVWTNELVKEFANDLPIDTIAGNKEIENFIKSKQPKLDYEILTIIENDTKEIIDCKYWLFNPDYYSIHSVKRLSDNEVFTIGDEIEIMNGKKYEINSFELNRLSQSITTHAGGKLWHFDYIKKARQPLFTTEDNVPIYEGDKWVIVQKRSFDILTDCIHPLTNPDLWFTFSTEEAANEYVLMNKPCLSLKEIVDNFYTYGGVPKGSEQYNNILQLAKQKTKSL